MFEIPLVDPLTLTIILSLFNPYINITSQSSLQLLFCYYLFLYLYFIQLTSMWFDPALAGLFITSTLLHLGEDINSLVVSPGPAGWPGTRLTRWLDRSGFNKRPVGATTWQNLVDPAGRPMNRATRANPDETRWILYQESVIKGWCCGSQWEWRELQPLARTGKRDLVMGVVWLSSLTWSNGFYAAVLPVLVYHVVV